MSSRRLAAIMFCDIVGYTAMMQRDEKEGLQKANRYREVLKEKVDQHGGKVVQHFGDGSLSVFHSAVQSLRCALVIQQTLMEAPQVPLRVGIHLGDIVLKGDDIYGDGVNVASRIENVADAGSVLFSESIYHHIRNHPDLPAKFLGDFQLKNVEENVRVYALTNAGLTVPARQSIFERIRSRTARQLTSRKPRIRQWAPMALVLLLATVAIFQWTRSRDQDAWNSPSAIPAIPATLMDNFKGEEGDRIAVIPFENRTGDPSYDMIGVMAADWITQKLLDTEEAKIVSLSTVQQNLDYVGVLPGNAEGRTSFAEATGANKLIEGSYYIQNDSLYLWAKISNTQSGELLYKMPAQTGAEGSPMSLVDQLSERIAGYWVTRNEVGKGKIHPPKMEAYKHWIEGRDSYGRDFAKSMKEFDKAIEMDSNFIMPYIGKLTLTMNDSKEREKVLKEIKQKNVRLTRYEKEFLDFVESDHPDKAFRHIMQIHEMDPKSFMEKNIAADVALRTNRPQVALDLVEDVANPHFNPANNFERNPVAIKAKALYQTGQYDDAIELIEEIPFANRDGSFHRIMIKSLVQSEDEEDVTDYIQQVVLHSPDDNASRWFQIASSEYSLIGHSEHATEMAEEAEEDLSEGARAYTYILAGKHEAAEEAYQELSEADPENHTYMARLGALKAELGAQEEALKCVNRILENVTNPANDNYLLATIYVQMGDLEKAMDHLKAAYASGYRFDDGNYGNDPLLDPMKEYQPFLDFIKPRTD